MTRRSLLRLGILGSLGATAVQIATVLVAYARPRAVPRVRVYAGRPSDYRLGEPVYLPEVRCHISLELDRGALVVDTRTPRRRTDFQPGQALPV